MTIARMTIRVPHIIKLPELSSALANLRILHTRWTEYWEDISVFNYTTEGILPKGEKPRIQSEFQGASTQNCRSRIANFNTFSHSHVSHQPIVCRRILRKKRLTTISFDSRTPQKIDASTGSNVGRCCLPRIARSRMLFLYLGVDFSGMQLALVLRMVRRYKFTRAYNDLSAHVLSSFANTAIHCEEELFEVLAS